MLSPHSKPVRDSNGLITCFYNFKWNLKSPNPLNSKEKSLNTIFLLGFVQVENHCIWFTLNLKLHIFSSRKAYVARITEKKANDPTVSSSQGGGQRAQRGSAPTAWKVHQPPFLTKECAGWCPCLKDYGPGVRLFRQGPGLRPPVPLTIEISVERRFRVIKRALMHYFYC